MGAFTSLSDIAAPETGTERQLGKPTAHHTMLVFVTGNPISYTVALEGSHDSFNWTRIGTLQGQTGGIYTTLPTTHLITWVRATLVELTGGITPTVTATIASAD